MFFMLSWNHGKTHIGRIWEGRGWSGFSIMPALGKCRTENCLRDLVRHHHFNFTATNMAIIAHICRNSVACSFTCWLSVHRLGYSQSVNA